MDDDTRAEMQLIIDDIFSGKLSQEMAEAGRNVVLSPREKATRLRWARERLEHHESRGDAYFAALERERIAQLEA